MISTVTGQYSMLAGVASQGWLAGGWLPIPGGTPAFGMAILPDLFYDLLVFIGQLFKAFPSPRHLVTSNITCQHNMLAALVSQI